MEIEAICSWNTLIAFVASGGHEELAAFANIHMWSSWTGAHTIEQLVEEGVNLILAQLHTFLASPHPFLCHPEREP